MAPPAGGDPTHTPHKTRLPYDFSSCNRPILVYDLVYASGGQCQGGYGGYRIQARPKIGYSKLSSLAEFTLQGWCHAGACPQRVWKAPYSPACFGGSGGFRLSQRLSVTPSESPALWCVLGAPNGPQDGWWWGALIMDRCVYLGKLSVISTPSRPHPSHINNIIAYGLFR